MKETSIFDKQLKLCKLMLGCEKNIELEEKIWLRIKIFCGERIDFQGL